MKQFYPLVLIALIFCLVSMKPSGNQEKTALEKSDVFIYSNNNTPDISISPNPVHRELILKSTSLLEIKTLGIHNISGRLIKNCSIKNSTINVQNLPTGIYYLKVTTDKNIITSRFIKR